jgi:hypothetical protein
VDRARAQAEPHLSGDVSLALVDEGVERLAERAEPQPVVHQLGIAALESGLLALQVTLETDRLEVGVRQHDGQAARALVRLAALDADAPVLDHVDATPAVGAHDLAELLDQVGRTERHAVE